ncbi:phosphodiester glycosidase family protein [Nocardioides montaniterrae]
MRLFPSMLTLALVAVLSPVAGATPGVQADEPPHPGPQVRDRGSDPHTWQTSDRVIGPAVPAMPRFARSTPARRTLRYRYDLRPGVRVASYDERIGSRRIRYYTVRANWRTPGVGFGLLEPPHHDMVQTVRWQARQDRGVVAAVNGDFFDIGETGAPLGLGVRGGSVEHGIDNGWNNAFFVNSKGVPHIGVKPVKLYAPLYPHLGLTNLNSPQVRPGGIGIYTPKWGTTSGLSWVQGQRTDIAMAHVVDHKVVQVKKVFTRGTPITGEYVVARGAHAVERLRRLAVGDTLWWRPTVANDPRMAITGNQIVLKDGRITATDNRELHPRTAVCIDPYHHWVFLLVVDGRQESSDGYTMVEIARKLRALGCSSGLNLDGGGSSTMVTTYKGDLRVRNAPSDGTPRRVGNGLGITFRRP